MSGYRLIIVILSIILAGLLWIPLNYVFGILTTTMNGMVTDANVIQNNNIMAQAFYFSLLVVIIALVIYAIKPTQGEGEDDLAPLYYPAQVIQGLLRIPGTLLDNIIQALGVAACPGWTTKILLGSMLAFLILPGIAGATFTKTSEVILANVYGCSGNPFIVPVNDSFYRTYYQHDNTGQYGQNSTLYDIDANYTYPMEVSVPAIEGSYSYGEGVIANVSYGCYMVASEQNVTVSNTHLTVMFNSTDCVTFDNKIVLDDVVIVEGIPNYVYAFNDTQLWVFQFKWNTTNTWNMNKIVINIPSMEIESVTLLFQETGMDYGRWPTFYLFEGQYYLYYSDYGTALYYRTNTTDNATSFSSRNTIISGLSSEYRSAVVDMCNKYYLVLETSWSGTTKIYEGDTPTSFSEIQTLSGNRFRPNAVSHNDTTMLLSAPQTGNTNIFQEVYYQECAAGGASESEDWPVERTYCLNLTIPASLIDEDIPNFPALAVFNSSNINYTATQPDGDDLIFYNADCGSGGSQVAHEIELWNESGDSPVWFQVITASSSTDTVYSVYFGNDTATNTENASGVWSDFEAIYHMANNATNASRVEDSAGTNFGSKPGGTTEPLQTTGLVGYAQSFDGTDDFVDLSSDIDFSTGNMTIEAWFNTSANPDAYDMMISKHDGGSNSMSLTNSWATQGQATFQTCDGTCDTATGATQGVMYNGIPHYYVGVRNGSSVLLFFDGTLNASASSTGDNFDESNLIRMGGRADNGNNDPTGVIDEVRISKSAKSDAYIMATYRTMTKQFPFYGIPRMATQPSIILNISVSPDPLYNTTGANFSISYNETHNYPADATVNITIYGDGTPAIYSYAGIPANTTFYIYLEPGNYSKGDTINVVVNVTTDHGETGNETFSRTVQNTVPGTPTITYGPESVISGDTFNATGSSSDDDNDTLTYWYVLGWSNGTNATGWITPIENTANASDIGLTFRVWAMADDGEANGTASYSDLIVTNMTILWPVNNTEYIGNTFNFSFNISLETTLSCTETINLTNGTATTYSLGYISSGTQNNSHYVWYGNNTYIVTCYSRLNSSLTYSKNVSFNNYYADWNVSIYTENDWDTPLNITDGNVTIFITCEGGDQFYYNLTGTSIDAIKPECDAESITAKVDYPSDSYARQRAVPDCTGCEIRMYMVDATVYTVLQTPIYMSDYNYYDSKIELYKQSGGNHYTIAEGWFDVEYKYVTYLTKDNTYYIRITLGDETRDIGFLYAATATAQYLSLSEISLYPSVRLIGDNLLMSAAFDDASNTTSTLRVRYEDLLNQTVSVRIRIFNMTSNTPWYDSTINGSSNITASINNLNTSVRYTVHFEVEHLVLGNSPVDYAVGVGAFGRLLDLGLPSGMEWLYPVMAFGVMLLTVLGLALPDIRIVILFLELVELGVFAIGGWLTILGNGVIALMLIFLVSGIIFEIRFRGTT